jgi:hypothetical protein
VAVLEKVPHGYKSVYSVINGFNITFKVPDSRALGHTQGTEPLDFDLQRRRIAYP